VEKFKPCPYCGILFSGKYGSEKRQKSRLKREIPFVFARNGQNIQACTVDMSDNGVCLHLLGSPSLPVGETIDFSINDIDLKAQVVWATENNPMSASLTGLKIVDGTIPAL
jgi:hypothetical protein